jgi:hypothetical protein
VLTILAIALLFAVATTPRELSWSWLGWAIAIAALVFGILVIEKGWPT